MLRQLGQGAEPAMAAAQVRPPDLDALSRPWSGRWPLSSLPATGDRPVLPALEPAA
jgi:hypothetical protein